MFRKSCRYILLAPAYDLLPVNIILPEDDKEFALTMNGKKQHLRRKDFLAFADGCGISRKAAEAMIGKMVACVPKWMKQCEESLLPTEMKETVDALISDRANILT